MTNTWEKKFKGRRLNFAYGILYLGGYQCMAGWIYCSESESRQNIMVTGTCGGGYSCHGSQAAERDRRGQKEATLQKHTHSGLFLSLRPYLLKLPVDETKLN